ncbi:MAG: M48 family metallopeptidase [Candidatus Marinimicrobia bacterium]|nr:M48 family metallopeptidase [Candidatus Neomarinimicrobiota bacterium]
MDEIFKRVGKKGGELYNRARWYWQSAAGTEQDAIKSEYILGRHLASDLPGHVKIDDSPDLNDRVRHIGRSLENRLKNKDRSFRYTILESGNLNAYALPGGFIFITLGLLDQIRDYPDEIAFVLGHEIMHVVLGHPLKRIFNGYGTKLLKVILANYSKTGAVTRQVIDQFMSGQYSQDMEFEADAGGKILMQAAGYNAEKSVRLLHRLKGVSGQKGRLYNYFSSHPPLEKRIEKLV